jgi:hypothetical protein
MQLIMVTRYGTNITEGRKNAEVRFAGASARKNAARWSAASVFILQPVSGRTDAERQYCITGSMDFACVTQLSTWAAPGGWRTSFLFPLASSIAL